MLLYFVAIHIHYGPLVSGSLLAHKIALVDEDNGKVSVQGFEMGDPYHWGAGYLGGSEKGQKGSKMTEFDRFPGGPKKSGFFLKKSVFRGVTYVFDTKNVHRMFTVPSPVTGIP